MLLCVQVIGSGMRQPIPTKVRNGTGKYGNNDTRPVLFEIRPPLKLVINIKPFEKPWRQMKDKRLPHHFMKQEKQKKGQRQVEVQQAGRGVAVLADAFFHSEKILEIRSHAAHYQAGQGKVFLSCGKEWNYKCRVRKRKWHRIIYRIISKGHAV